MAVGGTGRHWDGDWEALGCPRWELGGTGMPGVGTGRHWDILGDTEMGDGGQWEAWAVPAAMPLLLCPGTCRGSSRWKWSAREAGEFFPVLFV